MWYFILFGIVWFFLVLWWDVRSDYKKWVEQKPVRHTKEMIIRSLLLTPSGAAFWLANFSILTLPIVVFMMGSWWWEFFDGWYNKKRGKPWRFNGSIDPDDSKLDSFLYHLSATKQGLLKWGLIIIFTTAYVLTKIL